MRIEGVFRLIDFDASVSYSDNQFVGTKCSSAYCPPEMFVMVDKDNCSTIRIRAHKTDEFGVPTHNDLSYSLLLAHPSFDMWSLGATLYQVLELVILRDINSLIRYVY